MLHDLNNFHEDVGRRRGCGIILGSRRLDRNLDVVRRVLRAIRRGHALWVRCVEATVKIIEAPSVGSRPGCRPGERARSAFARSNRPHRHPRYRQPLSHRRQPLRRWQLLYPLCGELRLGPELRKLAHSAASARRSLQSRGGASRWARASRLVRPSAEPSRRAKRSLGVGWRYYRRRGVDRRDDLRKFGTPRARAMRDGFRRDDRSRRRRTEHRLRSGRRLRDHGGDGRRDTLLHGTILRERKRLCGGFFRVGSARRQKCANNKLRKSENVYDGR